MVMVRTIRQFVVMYIDIVWQLSEEKRNAPVVRHKNEFDTPDPQDQKMCRLNTTKSYTVNSTKSKKDAYKTLTPGIMELLPQSTKVETNWSLIITEVYSSI